jgi:protein-L-isoaspartate(D-aspartate) O-methyltransferase
MDRDDEPPRAQRFPIGLERVSSRASKPGTDTLLRPQRPLQQAAADQARKAPPSGLGLDSAAVRQALAQRLRAGGLHHEAVLAAIGRVERHRFVDSALVPQAYEDTSLPIGLSQTISKPSVVGWMLALLFEGANAQRQGHLGRVLEVGTGCGYQAALLLELGRSVVSIERLEPLHHKAAANLTALRAAPGGRQADLRLVFGDGRLGHAPRAPYDSIIAAAGGDDLPAAWLDQLAVGGRLVAPVQGPAGQRLRVVDRHALGHTSQELEAVNFVPLKSGTA